MISTVKGKIEEISPTHVILECSGIGYHIHISLNTFTSIADHREVKLYTSFIVREGGEQLLYGFWTKDGGARRGEGLRASSAYFAISRSSTSKISVELGGMPGTPRAP